MAKDLSTMNGIIWKTMKRHFLWLIPALLIFFPGCLNTEGLDETDKLKDDNPPFVNEIPDAFLLPNTVYTYEVIAADKERIKIKYELLIAPDGMRVDSESGKITWISESTGDYPVMVGVSDDVNQSRASFKISVFDIRIPNNEKAYYDQVYEYVSKTKNINRAVGWHYRGIG